MARRVALAALPAAALSAAPFSDLWTWHRPRLVDDVQVSATMAADGSVRASGTLPGADGAVATLFFDDTIRLDGWSHLLLESNSSFSDEQQAYVAGYLEATQTWKKIYEGVMNTGANFTYDPALTFFLAANEDFMRTNFAVNAADPYWHQLSLLWIQLDGMIYGYQDATAGQAGYALPPTAIFNVQLSGDMEDLSAAVGLQAGLTTVSNPRASKRSRARAAALRQEWLSLSAAARGERQLWRDEEGRVTDMLDPPGQDGSGHCSALVAVLPDGSDVFFSQVTWAGFEDMTRVFKQYQLPYTLNGARAAAQDGKTRSVVPALSGLDGSSTVPAARVSFSSDPASLFSGDDFYTMTSGLAMLETTIGNNNATLYQLHVKPDTVLEWARNMVANRLATDGASWAAIYSAFNSGTYNNENIIIDYNKFTPAATATASANSGATTVTGGAASSNAGAALRAASTKASSTASAQRAPLKLNPGLLTVLDQVPGFIEWHDLTDELQSNGYVASYNVARFPAIYNISGNYPLFQKYGPWFSFNATARANIFRRDHVKITDEQGLRGVMRYNDFTHDPLSTEGCSGNPPYSAENAISARDDLNSPTGVYPIDALGFRDHAGIDAKYTTYALMSGLGLGLGVGKDSGSGSGADAASGVRANPAPGSWTAAAWAISGPTYDQQPPFSWSTTPFSTLGHLGQPDDWTFDWVMMFWQPPSAK